MTWQWLFGATAQEEGNQENIEETPQFSLEFTFSHPTRGIFHDWCNFRHSSRHSQYTLPSNAMRIDFELEILRLQVAVLEVAVAKASLTGKLGSGEIP